jgi:MoaA/NifB/PqqE/SkfB family radical SAM enzyme
MHPDLVKMIRYASDKKKSVNFTTNATLLPKQTDALLDAGLDAIAFSFPDAAQFAPVISRNVSRFVRQRVEKNQKKPKTYINIALMEGHFGSVEDGLALAKSVGVDVVNFERSFPWTEEQTLSEPGLFTRIRSAAKKTGCKVTLPVPHTNRCPLFQLTLFVRWNGDVAPCCYRADHVLGNVSRDSFLSIIQKRAEFQKTMKTDLICGQCRV